MDNQVSILIIEDEGIVGLELQESLQDEGFDVVGVADNGPEAIELLQANEVDLVLLDINIKGNWDGIQTATEIKKRKNIPFIYVTAYADGATFERAKKTLPSAYLTKPFQIKDLRKAIELALYHFSTQQPAAEIKDKPVKKDNSDCESILHFNNAVFIKQNYKYNKIAYESILYLKADGNYTYIHTVDKKFVIKYSLQQVIDIFNTSIFVRVHRSYAINMGHLTSFNENTLQLYEESIPIGRNYKDVFLRLFKQL